MMVVSVPYGDWVLNAEDAFALVKLFERSERYQEKYRSGGENTHHVWMQDAKMPMFAITEDLYRMAKVAGKPEK